MSSLAAQLAQSASLNTNLLADRSRRKAGESYLFTGREADRYDLDSIHALGVNGLIQLSSLNPLLRTYEETFFSEHAKATDRTQLTVDANTDLDKSIGAFMALLGPYLMENPTGKVLEWLVRRFRINEFNLDEVLSLFLPYHESPHFAKMVTILHVKPNSMWSFLSSYKSAAQSLPRVSLVTEMVRNSDLSRFVVSLLPNAIKDGYSHRVLLAFNAATLHEFLGRSKNLDEGSLAYLLPALLEPLKNNQQQASKDAILGSYILLSSLSHRCQFSSAAMKSILSAMASCGHQVSTSQFLNAAVAILGHQPELPRISSGTAKAILRLPNFNHELVAVLKFIGSEKLVLPLLSILESRFNDEQVISLFEAIITSATSPPIVNERATYILMKSLMSLNSQALDASAALRMLSIIQQRYPTVLAKIASKISQEESISADFVDQLIVSLSAPLTEPFSDKKNVDMILASGSADAKVRSIAVKELLTTLSKTESIDDDLSSAFLARVHDSDLQVLEALYAEPAVLTRVFSQNATTYIDNLSQAIVTPSAKPKRSVIRIHLSYLVSHLCPSLDTTVLDQVFHEILFPFLLFSKPRQRTAELVWDIIAQHLEDPKYNAALGFGLINGFAGVVNEMKDKNNDANVEKMASLNATLSSKIAQNMMKSNHFPVYLEQLLQKLENEDAHIRVLGYLVTNALLAQLSGDHQIDVAIKILDVIKTRKLSSIDNIPLERLDILESVYEEFLGKTVVLKPSSRATLQWLEISIIGTIAHMPRPTGIVLDWFSDSSSPMSNKHAFGYIKLMRQVYVLAHTCSSSSSSSSSSSELTIHLLRALFIGLKDDSLAFLAGIWAGAVGQTGSVPADLFVVALRHGVAFLEAHILEDDGVDFQTILPSLLVALQSMNIHIRQGALDCISRLRILSERKLVSVYRFDAIYGDRGGQLQYLDHNDCKRHLDGLIELRDHFVHDTTFTKVFYQQHLGHVKSDKKRDSEYKHRVLCYLLSHVNGIGLRSAQVQLLGSLEGISDKSKAMILKSTLSNLSDMASSTADTLSKDSEELTSLLLACLDSSVTEDLNDSRSELWNIYISIINSFFKSAHTQRGQSTLVWSLENGLYAGLALERKSTLAELLLDLGAEYPNAYASCKKILNQALHDVPLIVHLLDLFSPNPSSTTGQHTNKRLRTMVTPDDTFSRLTLLVEVLASKALPGSLDLISRLLETLNLVVQSSSHNHADVSYIEQLLMSSVENSATKILEAPNISPSAIRLDILVEVIRIADNPQTFHQALLLIASIARLAPESVLHNVMPIFTFMGSNVFHRDDSHSFRVVQQTIEGIVPVMVSSLKQANAQSLELYIASKEFLRVFTDASHHIPRHRRNNFFAHLVNVLGHGDFLAPICMLLIDKVTNRVVRQNVEDAKVSFALPIAVLHHGSKISQLTTLLEILREAQRLAARVRQPDNPQPTFLEGVLDTEHSMPASTIMRRQAQALISFVGFGLKAMTADTSDSLAEKQPLNAVVATLIALASPQESRMPETRTDEISQVARNSLNRLVGILSAADFLDAVLSMLEIDDQHVKQGALELLGERLPHVSEKVRAEAVPIINTILLLLKQIISSLSPGSLSVSALKALKSITITLRPGEENSLTDMIPLVLATTEVSELSAAAFSALVPMPTKLGPRMIPYFRDTVAASVQILQQGNQATTADSLTVMQALLRSIPTFWGAREVIQVTNLYLEHFVSTSGSPSIAMSSFMKAFTKKVSTKALLLALIEMWPSIQHSAQAVRIVGYFQVLTRTLRNALRPSISENLRSLFKLFLEALDIIMAMDETHLGELQILSAFKELVVKLNETAFRPLFRHLYDWAFAGTEVDARRQVTFCRLYINLLDFFKGLMVPYMSFLTQPFLNILKQYIDSTSESLKLWLCLVETLTKSMIFDDGTFWRDDKLRQIASPLISQIPVSVRLNTPEANANLLECISALADSTSDDTILKSINLDILMHTRSENVRLRLFAITCSESLWRIHGGKLLGFVAETIAFIAECGEDENDMVIKESFKLKNAVENVAGRIDGL